jgi:cystathionine gamma-lyase/homocysteine desulfhydrase
MRLATRLIHHPGAVCEQTGAVSPPIYLASTFRQEAVGRGSGYEYGRADNPTRHALEDYIADLEGGRVGAAFGSGMAAVSACLMLLRAGDHVVATEGLYGGTYHVLRTVFSSFEIGASFVDTARPDAIDAAMRPNTRALLLETPSNPLMHVTDIAAAAQVAHARDALVIVDNTFMSPYLQRPLGLGADIVVNSATKFLGGHSDLIAGLAVTADEALGRRIRRIQHAVGAVPGPFDCWLLMRGMKTLGVRMDRSQAGAARIAEWLSSRPEVVRVLYPTGEVHRRQAAGPGGVLSFELRQDVPTEQFVASVRVWTLAVSLGAVESIITVPAKMTHLSYPPRERERLGLGGNLVRLSVGIEDVDDLIADLVQAFDRLS